MNDEHQSLFTAIAALLGAVRDDREEASHLCRFRLGKLEFYFSSDWRDRSKGAIRAAKPLAWGTTNEVGPRIGFSLSRTPEAIARDTQRRWLKKATEWHWQKVREKQEADRRDTEKERLAVEALMEANGSRFTYEEAMREACGTTRGETFRGHGIEFRQYDLRPCSYHGFRMQIEVRNEAALRMIA